MTLNVSTKKNEKKKKKEKYLLQIYFPVQCFQWLLTLDTFVLKVLLDDACNG